METIVQGWTLFSRGTKVPRLSDAVVIALLLTMVGSLGCQTVPVTGRKRIVLVSETSEMKLGLDAYEETLAGEQLSTNLQLTDMVQRVGDRLARVANRPDFDWEFRLINSPQQNAFCLPGGKVAIYEGILPVCQNEAGLAVVMSHEVAHALARHGAERMTHGYMVNGLGTVLSSVTSSQDEVLRNRLMQGYGVASQYGFVLPYSRKHESEADQVGLILMAQAGYDPAVAPEFWRRFGTAKSGEKTPEFLSTHPNDERRAADLQLQLAGAKSLYDAAAEKFGTGEPIQFRVVQAESPPDTPLPSDGQIAQQADSPTGVPPDSIQAVTYESPLAEAAASPSADIELSEPAVAPPAKFGPHYAPSSGPLQDLGNPLRE